MTDKKHSRSRRPFRRLRAAAMKPWPQWFDTGIFALMLVASLVFAGRAWLADHPQHNPWAPLDLRDERGWATDRKLAALRSDPEECRAVLERSEVRFTPLDPAGEGECRREDRLVLGELPLRPADVQISCPVAAALVTWVEKDLQPLAQDKLGARIASIEHLGAYSCRRLYGAETGRWSEHATGNAIDIAAFVLEDGQRIVLRGDWDGDAQEALFLREARDSACDSFGTVLSPDYNAAHADHFHLDQARRMGFSVCR